MLRLKPILRIALCLLPTITQAGTQAGTQAADQPNILFIMADDVGSEVLQCYGGQSYPTPRLDELATSGMRFEHAYSMSVCHPTRTALLSGQYPFRMGHPKWGSYPKNAESKTFAHVLKNAGYRTAVAGKWQIAMLRDDPTHPQRLGFDQSCLFGWHEGPRYFQPHLWQNGKLRTDVKDRYGPDVYCEFLIDFMTKKSDKPFFAYYPMALCHAVTNDLDHPVPVGPQGRYQNYAEMVAAMDNCVGRLLDALDQANLSEHTLVIFYTDNGTPGKIITEVQNNQLVYKPVSSQRNNQQIPGGKTLLTDSGTRVPLIARWPTKIRPGQVNHDLIDVSDFLPTFAELAGTPLPSQASIDGQSFAPLLLGTKHQPRSWVFAEHKGHSYLKDHRWKLYNDNRFYDTTTDPTEQHPLDTTTLTPPAKISHQQLQEARQELMQE